MEVGPPGMDTVNGRTMAERNCGVIPIFIEFDSLMEGIASRLAL